jgi:hypothetical protein
MFEQITHVIYELHYARFFLIVAQLVKGYRHLNTCPFLSLLNKTHSWYCICCVNVSCSVHCSRPSLLLSTTRSVRGCSADIGGKDSICAYSERKRGFLYTRRISIAEVGEETGENKLGTERFKIQNHFIRRLYHKIRIPKRRQMFGQIFVVHAETRIDLTTSCPLFIPLSTSPHSYYYPPPSEKSRMEHKGILFRCF